ncbi:hypothetical protein CY0110_31830, partial [Crocosphaera chwakensis CCY0110]
YARVMHTKARKKGFFTSVKAQKRALIVLKCEL